MRIVAGKWRSRPLATLKGSATRPTLDKVREAVFSSLGQSFAGGSMLDLYAGSGAVAYEALSRGMDDAVLVDQSAAAAAVIRANKRTLQADAARILNMSDTAALKLLAAEGRAFDLVYLDPPYAQQRLREVLQFLADHAMVKPGGSVVLESAREDSFTGTYGPLYKAREAVYGITSITYYKALEGASL